MSQEKLDVRLKVDPITLAFLKAEAKTRGIDVADLVRELLDKFADSRRVAFIEAQKILAAQGNLGALQGPSGRFAARSADVIDLDTAV